jgi:hypothetical protein
MEFLFLRSQLVDIEFGVRSRADIGDVDLGFNPGFGNRFDAGRRRSGSLWFRVAGRRARRRRGRLGRGDTADSFGDFIFQRASGAGLQGNGREAG